MWRKITCTSCGDKWVVKIISELSHFKKSANSPKSGQNEALCEDCEDMKKLSAISS